MKTTVLLRLATVAFICLVCFTFFAIPLKLELSSSQSLTQAILSLEVTSKGWLPKLPLLDPNTNQILSYPFFFYWINGGIMRAFGPSESTARILPLFFFLGSALLIMAFGARSQNYLRGFLAGLFFLIFKSVLNLEISESFESIALFFFLLSLFFHWKKNQIGMGIAAGISLWSNSYLSLIFYPLVCSIQFFEPKKASPPRLLMKSFAIYLFVGSWIWIASGWMTGSWIRIPFHWDFHGKLYLSLILPLAALMLSELLYPHIRFWENHIYSLTFYLSLFLGLFLLCTPFPTSIARYTDLKRFIPFIQEDSCDDPIVLFKTGKFDDLSRKLFLRFYTNNPIHQAECEAIGLQIKNIEPTWLILSEENYKNCLTPSEKALFKTGYQWQGTLLLSSLEGKRSILTPLERGLRPALNCIAPAYPKDMYHRY